MAAAGGGRQSDRRDDRLESRDFILSRDSIHAI